MTNKAQMQAVIGCKPHYSCLSKLRKDQKTKLLKLNTHYFAVELLVHQWRRPKLTQWRENGYSSIFIYNLFTELETPIQHCNTTIELNQFFKMRLYIVSFFEKGLYGVLNLLWSQKSSYLSTSLSQIQQLSHLKNIYFFCPVKSVWNSIWKQ